MEDIKIINKGDKGFDSIGLGIGVYIIITQPLEQLWDKVIMPNKPLLGTSLEKHIKNLIDNDEIGNEDDYIIDESDYQWIILGKGDGIFATPPEFIIGLENEMAIYNHFNHDKNDSEVIVSCFDHNDKEIKGHRILRIPYEWNLYNEQQLQNLK